MTKLRGATFLIVIGLVAVSAAPAQVRHDIATDRARLQSERQAIVAANLPLTEEQAKAFWPMFRQYRADLAKLGDRMVDLVLDYAKNLETLSDVQAKAMLDEYLSIQKEEVKLKSEWAPRFGKILPPKAVTRFYQIENKLDSILRFEAVGQIPLVDSARP